MKKIINPVTCRYGYYNKMANAFCEIEYENGKLSITGVVGPTRNGNCKGSCGQCYGEIRTGEPTSEWTKQMVDKLCDIWEKWHLNDMSPYCQHQKDLGWDKLSSKEVVLYNYTLTRKAIEEKRKAESAAIDALKEGETFTPSTEQTMYATLPYSITLPEEISGENALYYEPKKPWRAGDEGATMKKTLGWLHPNEHPEGILTRECPVCGYKYGTKWLKEEVPQEVIDWLFNLPDTKVTPAWV